MRHALALFLSLSFIGCAPKETAFSRYQAAYMAHPTQFTTTIDSSDILWERARDYLMRRTTLAVDNDTVLQTPPRGEGDSPGVIVRRWEYTETVHFEAIRMNTSYDKYSSSWGLESEESARKSQPQARELLFVIRTGRSKADYADPRVSSPSASDSPPSQ